MLQKDSNTHFWKARLCSVKWNLGHPPTVLQATAAADSPVHIPAIPCFYWPVMPCQEPEEEGMWGSEQLRGKQGEDTEKEDARRNGRSRQRKREPQERGVRYTWKRFQHFTRRILTNPRQAQYWGGKRDGEKTSRTLSIWRRYVKMWQLSDSLLWLEACKLQASTSTKKSVGKAVHQLSGSQPRKPQDHPTAPSAWQMSVSEEFFRKKKAEAHAAYMSLMKCSLKGVWRISERGKFSRIVKVRVINITIISWQH